MVWIVYESAKQRLFIETFILLVMKVYMIKLAKMYQECNTLGRVYNSHSGSQDINSWI